jgi:imidazolonepropionase-like amidohydrolase
MPASEKYNAKETIAGNGRLVCPGFIDTHMHLTDILGDFENAPEYLVKDSIAAYKKRIAETYLPYGTTTIKVDGQPEKWITPSLDWQNNPKPDFPDIYICGGALISHEGRIPYAGHAEVKDAADAARKVQAYHDLGIRYIKLYWRLRIPEFIGAIKKAQELKMNVCGHLETAVTIDTALYYGLRHFEHLFTLESSIPFRTMEEYNAVLAGLDKNFKSKSFMPYIMENFRYKAEQPDLREKMDSLIDEMAKDSATLSTTIHVFGSYAGRTYFRTFFQTKLHTEDVPETFTDVQKQRLGEDFDIMMKYLKRAHEKGVKIVIGTDCMDGGKAMISEMLLLYEAGFAIGDILKIATINGAASMDLGNKYGSIRAGKKADLVIFDKNPFLDYKNFLSEKIVIKDGKVYRK